ncbi:MAG TPA: ADP-glyceromanno-heptose 6-epimerase [Tepidisphaeraceae bacterium]|nr:ADP-glyceromanno-heptose 6-epimerase [Tepidisphaeraceae bacterium]
MRVLVTGGAGFTGSNLARRLAALGHEVVASDNFSSAHWSNLTDFSGDVTATDAAHLGPFEIIFHHASITDTTVHDQKMMMQNNLEHFRSLLDLAMKWNSRVVWASSASIYGRNTPPNIETQNPNPLNVYAYSKLAMERLARLYQSRLRQPIIGLRYFNVYGPGEDHKGKFASMIHQLARQMRAGQRPRIFTAGEQKRDFVYVDDVVSANLLAAKASTGGVFNVGCGKAETFNQIVAELNRALKTNLEPDYFDNPYGFTQDWTQADLTASRRALGYEPKFNLTAGIDAYLASGKLGMGDL